MERVARVDEAGTAALMLVREEAGLDRLEAAAAACDLEHRRRRVDGDDAAGDGRRRSGEQARARAEVDERRATVQAELAEQRHVVGDVEAGLAVVPRDVRGIEMLLPGKDPLVDQGAIPQRASKTSPGSSRMTSSPVRNASFLHVIGSTATDRRATSGRSSPV